MTEPNMWECPISIAIIGCGKLGTALLRGFLLKEESTSSITKFEALRHPLSDGFQISQITVTVRESTSVERLQNTILSTQRSLSQPRHPALKVVIRMAHENGLVAYEADVVILGCEPSSFSDILSDAAVRRGLCESGKKKTLVSILGGVTSQELHRCLYDSEVPTPVQSHISPSPNGCKKSCRIVRAIPNIAACIRESMTVIAYSSPLSQQKNQEREREQEEKGLVGALFNRLGTTRWVPEDQMNHASALCASTLAFYAQMIAAAAVGAMEDGKGLSWDDAIHISAQAARGTTGLILAGQDPQHVKNEVTTKGGATMQGLQVLSNRDVPKAIREALEKTILSTKGLASPNPK